MRRLLLIVLLLCSLFNTGLAMSKLIPSPTSKQFSVNQADPFTALDSTTRKPVKGFLNNGTKTYSVQPSVPLGSHNVKYSFSQVSNRLDRDYHYRVTIVPVQCSWGFLTMCDHSGHALFTPTDVQNVQSVKHFCLPGQANSVEVDSHSSLYLTGEAVARTDSALVFLVALCVIEPTDDDDLSKHQHDSLELKWAALELKWAFLELKWAALDLWLFNEMVLSFIVAIPQMIMCLWFARKCIEFRAHVMTMQKIFLLLVLLSFLCSTIVGCYLLNVEINGVYNWNTTPATITVVFLLIKVLVTYCFAILLLATAKGWGVVHLFLPLKDKVSIGVFSLLFIGLHFWPQGLFLVQGYLLAWIPLSLSATVSELEQSGGNDRHRKLEMYRMLQRFLVMAIAIWIIVAVLMAIAASNGYVDLVIVSIAAWDFALLFLMCGFGYLWAPSPATAQFSFVSSARVMAEESVRDELQRVNGASVPGESPDL